MRKWIVHGLTPILCGLALLLGVIGLGRAARASLHERTTYNFAFADIDCLPPQGMSREVFLSEVQGHTNQPRVLTLLDEELIARLHRAFAVHPWVDSVRRVDIGTPRRVGRSTQTVVHLDLLYRQPVLAVPLSTEAKAEKARTERNWRLVDRQSIVLPVATVPAHLPVLAVPVAAPPGSPGTRWGDARVAAAAKTAAFLQPHLTHLHLDDSQIELKEGAIVFCRPFVRVVWGHAPGQEEKGEAPAKVKLQRLLDYQKAHEGLERLEHDVRLLAYQGHFPLALDQSQVAVSLYGAKQLPSSRNCDHVSNSSRSWRSCFSDAKAAPASASSR
jgi:hypothetical protein